MQAYLGVSPYSLVKPSRIAALLLETAPLMWIKTSLAGKCAQDGSLRSN